MPLIPRLPRVAPNGQLSADGLNRAMTEIERLARLSAVPPLYVRQEPTGYILTLNQEDLLTTVTVDMTYEGDVTFEGDVSFTGTNVSTSSLTTFTFGGPTVFNHAPSYGVLRVAWSTDQDVYELPDNITCLLVEIPAGTDITLHSISPATVPPTNTSRLLYIHVLMTSLGNPPNLTLKNQSLLAGVEPTEMFDLPHGEDLVLTGGEGIGLGYFRGTSITSRWYALDDKDIVGPGQTNFLARWTPDEFTLGHGVTKDNGTETILLGSVKSKTTAYNSFTNPFTMSGSASLWVRLVPDSAVNMIGIDAIEAAPDGGGRDREYWIYNAGTATITLAHLHPDADEVDRMILPTDEDYELPPRAVARCHWAEHDNCWRVWPFAFAGGTGTLLADAADPAGALVAWYPLNDGEGLSPSVFFDGVNDRLVTTDTDLQPAQITLAARFMPSNLPAGYQSILNMTYDDDAGSVVSPFECWNLGANDGSANVPYGSLTVGGVFVDIHADAAPSVGQEIVLVMTFDGTDLKLYVDGTLQADTEAISGNIDYSQNASGVMSVGCSHATITPQGFLKGFLGEVWIYNRALSGTEVSDLSSGSPPASGKIYNLKASELATDEGLTHFDPVSQWDDETATTTGAAQATAANKPLYYDASTSDVRDLSVNANHGDLQSGAVFVDDEEAFFGRALDLNGTSDYASSADQPDYSISGNCSFLCRVKFATVADGMVFFGQSEGTGNDTPRWALGYGLSTSGTLEFHLCDDGLGAGVFLFAHAWTPTADTWYSLAVTRKANAWTLYIDGVSVDTDTNATAFPDPVSSLYIGIADGTNDTFDGRLADLRIYSRALTATQASNWHSTGNPHA